MCACQRLQDPVPDAGPSPANEPIVASGAGSIDGWEIPPGSARSQYPEDAIEDAPIIDAGYAARLGREHRSEEHTSELQSQSNLVCRLLLEKKKQTTQTSEAI